MLMSCRLPHLVTGSLSSCCLFSPEGSSSSTASRLDAPIPLPSVCSLSAGHQQACTTHSGRTRFCAACRPETHCKQVCLHVVRAQLADLSPLGS